MCSRRRCPVPRAGVMGGHCAEASVPAAVDTITSVAPAWLPPLAAGAGWKRPSSGASAGQGEQPTAVWTSCTDDILACGTVQTAESGGLIDLARNMMPIRKWRDHLDLCMTFCRGVW